jgi:hypothetical protein
MSILPESALSHGQAHTFLELAFVLRAVEMALRVLDETGIIKLPKFVAAYANAIFRF